MGGAFLFRAPPRPAAPSGAFSAAGERWAGGRGGRPPGGLLHCMPGAPRGDAARHALRQACVPGRVHLLRWAARAATDPPSHRLACGGARGAVNSDLTHKLGFTALVWSLLIGQVSLMELQATLAMMPAALHRRSCHWPLKESAGWRAAVRWSVAPSMRSDPQAGDCRHNRVVLFCRLLVRNLQTPARIPAALRFRP